MRKLAAYIMIALLFALPAVAETPVEEITAVDVQGFWYSDEVDDGIELLDGKVIISDADGVTSAEGTYTVEENKVTIVAGTDTYQGVVAGNSMMLEMGGGTKRYARDGIEENYWTSVNDDSAIELFDGRAWQYNHDGDLTGEGTYEIDGLDLIITMGDKVLTGVIDGNTLTVDGAEYSRL